MANAQLDITFTTNRLGKQNLIHNGFKFHIKNRRGDIIYWQCSTRDCRSTINTLNNIPTKIARNHNHQPDPTKLKVDSILQTMKDRARDELTPIPTIYEEELVKLRNREWNDDTQQLVQQIPTFQSCKDLFYNQRHKTLPSLPSSLADLQLQGEWTETTTGQQFLLADDNTNGRILLFSTQQNLTHFAAADTVYGDGINIKGCFFHYTQCIWRNAQKHGLQVPYKDNDGIRTLVRRAAVLPLLPPNTVEDVWFAALEDIEDIDIPTLPFTDYVTSYWVEGNQDLWNHHATEGPRTTNYMPCYLVLDYYALLLIKS